MVEIFPIKAVPVKGRGTTKWWKGSIKKVAKKNPPVTCVTAPFNKGAFFVWFNALHPFKGDLFIWFNVSRPFNKGGFFVVEIFFVKGALWRGAGGKNGRFGVKKQTQYKNSKLYKKLYIFFV